MTPLAAAAAGRWTNPILVTLFIATLFPHVYFRIYIPNMNVVIFNLTSFNFCILYCILTPFIVSAIILPSFLIVQFL